MTITKKKEKMSPLLQPHDMILDGEVTEVGVCLRGARF